MSATAHQFLFALDLSGHSHFDQMLDEVARNVLGHVGYAHDTTAELVALLHAALLEGAAHASHQRRVQFSAALGELQIVVSFGGGREWRTRRALP